MAIGERRVCRVYLTSPLHKLYKIALKKIKFVRIYKENTSLNKNLSIHYPISFSRSYSK